MLANGQLLRGHSGVAGHRGHLTVDPDGPVCVCGNRGCLKTVFSARARGLLRREVPLVEQQVANKSGIVGAAGLVMAPRG